MNEILQGLAQAARLLAGLNPDLIEITWLSLRVSVTATLVAALLALPLGAWLAVSRFRARRVVIAGLNALMGLPPVVWG